MEEHDIFGILYWLLNISTSTMHNAKSKLLVLENSRNQQVTWIKEQGIKKEDWFIVKRKSVSKKIN